MHLWWRVAIATRHLLACISGVAEMRARFEASGRAHDPQDGIENRLRELARIFSVAGGGGSVLDNHLHVRRRLDPQVAAARTDEEVVRRSARHFPVRDGTRTATETRTRPVSSPQTVVRRFFVMSFFYFFYHYR